MRLDLTDTVTAARLLLVDDDAMLRDMAQKTLHHSGFVVTAVENGNDALQVFEQEHFDLVLLDVMMPGLDGFEVCARMRQQPRGATLPILMLTGLNDTESIEASFRAGATDFVTKPINWTLLNHRVRYSLRAGVAAENIRGISERLARAQRLANMGSWEWSPSTLEFICSDELCRIFAGSDIGEGALSVADFLAQVCEEDRREVAKAREAAAADGHDYQIRFSIVRADGKRRSIFEQAVTLRDDHGKVFKVEGITQDITERVTANQKIRQLAFYDNVTGLPNRRYFAEMTQVALERSRRLRSICAVMHLDLDRFKSVNDAFGQAGGDAILRMVGDRLKAALRSGDLKAANSGERPAELLARTNGNSFAILLLDLVNRQAAARVATRLLNTIAEPMVLDEREALLTASVGIALFPRDGEEIQELSQKAEQAAYAAKAAGRATHRFFDEKLNAVASGRLSLANDLRRCVAAGELRLHFQPKVNARKGNMLGAEVLVRWQHPTRGMVSPGDFIPLAEELGLIVPLGEWVLETACAALGRWRRNGMAVVPLSINMSSPSFLQENLVTQLDEVVSRNGIDPQQLTLEVTESVLMTDTERTVARLQTLRERGFGLSLDDFGTGYSSLSYLKKLPIDELKIDRSFVRDMAQSERDAALVGSIIAMGRQFGLSVVAEGVETEAQAGLLINRGCLHQQGYLFARPMPLEDFERALSEGKMFSAAAGKTVFSFSGRR